MFEIGDEYCILTSGRAIACKIVNSYEEYPNKWVLVLREPETGTLLRRFRFILKNPIKLVPPEGNLDKS